MHILSYMSGDNRRSILHGIPMQHLDYIRKLFAKDGFKIKVRYRGPRKHRYVSGASVCSRFNARCNCLKADATTFAVYSR